MSLFPTLTCHYFLHLQSTLCTHTCPIFCILLLYSAAQKMKTPSRHASPRSSTCGLLFRCVDLLVL
jgi:hypothetical protein